MLFLSSIPHAIYILYSIYPTPFKIFTSSLLWLSFILSIKNITYHFKPNNHFRLIEINILFLILLSTLQFIRYFIYGGESTLMTTLMNPYYGLCLLTPVLYFSLQSYALIKLIYKYSIILILISSASFNSNYYILYITPFLIYTSYTTKYKVSVHLLFLLSIALIIKDAIIPDKFTGDTQRALLIISAYSLITLSIFFLKRYCKFIAKIIIGLSLIIPISLCIYAIKTQNSPFIYLSELQNEEIGRDNRTFLYDEVLRDLSKNDCIINGFGISNGYYSPYFSQTIKDKRDVNEVTILHFLFRGGLIWVLLYLSIIIYAILYSLRKSKNNLCLGGSIMLSGYFFSSFIIDTNSINFIHVIVWFYIAICSSPKFTKLSNCDIIKLLK